MVKYSSTAVTSKVGVNYVRSLVERAGSLFHKIEQENDLGIDALIEFVVENKPAAIQVALQIRSGDSYYDPASATCQIPVESHREYWTRYPLPVAGVVFVPSLGRAHWVDLKRSLAADPGNLMKFAASRANLLDHETFISLFRSRWLKEKPHLAFAQAIEFTASNHMDEAHLGLRVLFDQYPNERQTWDVLIGYFVKSPADRIPLGLIYHLAHIPWHGDIYYNGEPLKPEIEEYAAARLATFGRPEVIKLLQLIDHDNGIARGTIGQSIEALVSSLPETDSHLVEIASSETLDLFVRESAGLILAMHHPDRAIPVLQSLASGGSWFAGELIRVIRELGGINPYS